MPTPFRLCLLTLALLAILVPASALPRVAAQTSPTPSTSPTPRTSVPVSTSVTASTSSTASTSPTPRTSPTAQASPSLTPRPTLTAQVVDVFPKVDLEVWTLGMSGTTLYVGGSFREIGYDTGGVALLNTETGDPYMVPPRYQSFIHYAKALAPDGTGGWVVAGSIFTHLRPDRTPDPQWTSSERASFYEEVRGLLVHGDTIYVGGSFTPNTPDDDDPQSYLAAARLSDGTLLPWSPAPNGPVTSLVISGTTLYVGGSFSQMAGQARSNLAAFNLSTGALLPWNAGTNGQVEKLAISGTTLYVGGSFTQALSQTRSNLAAFNLSTGALLPWNAGTNGSVSALTITGTTLYAGGTFTQTLGQARNRLAAFGLSDGALLAWNPALTLPLTSTLTDLESSGTTVYVATNPNRFREGNYPLPLPDSLIALDSRTGQRRAQPWMPGDLGVRDLARSGSTLGIAGEFWYSGIQERVGLAAIDTQTYNILPWKAALEERILTSVISGTTLYVGIQDSDQIPGPHVMGLRLSDGTALPWHIRTNETWLTDLAVYGNTLYVSGDFTHVDGQARSGLAAIDVTTGSLVSSTLHLDGTGYISQLEIANNTLYLSGGFTSIGGQARTNLAAIRLRDGALLPWNPAPNGKIDDINGLLLTPQRLYVTGTFTEIAGQPRAGVAAFDPQTGQLLDWKPAVSGVPLAGSPDGRIVYYRQSDGLVAVDTTTEQQVAFWDWARLRPLDHAVIGLATTNTLYLANRGIVGGLCCLSALRIEVPTATGTARTATPTGTARTATPTGTARTATPTGTVRTATPTGTSTTRKAYVPLIRR